MDTLRGGGSQCQRMRCGKLCEGLKVISIVDNNATLTSARSLILFINLIVVIDTSIPHPSHDHRFQTGANARVRDPGCHTRWMMLTITSSPKIP